MLFKFVTNSNSKADSSCKEHSHTCPIFLHLNHINSGDFGNRLPRILLWRFYNFRVKN